ncbi:MAG: hypothetical protein ACSLE2_20130 [Lysobacterales bacterium]
MTDSPIKYTPPPAYCGDCFNRVLNIAAANPEQSLVSVYCPHGKSLITGQTMDHDGERVIWCWSISGPMNEAQAVQGMQLAAESVGAVPVVDYGDLLN